MEGGNLAREIILGEELAHVGHGGVVGRGGAGGERIKRAQRNVGKEQADLERPPARPWRDDRP